MKPKRQHPLRARRRATFSTRATASCSVAPWTATSNGDPSDGTVVDGRNCWDDDRFASTSELVLQHYSIRLGDFEGIDPRRIREVRFVFDRTESGEVVLDDIVFSNLGEDWLTVSGSGR